MILSTSHPDVQAGATASRQGKLCGYYSKTHAEEIAKEGITLHDYVDLDGNVVQCTTVFVVGSTGIFKYFQEFDDAKKLGFVTYKPATNWAKTAERLSTQNTLTAEAGSALKKGVNEFRDSFAVGDLSTRIGDKP